MSAASSEPQVIAACPHQLNPFAHEISSVAGNCEACAPPGPRHVWLPRLAKVRGEIEKVSSKRACAKDEALRCKLGLREGVDEKRCKRVDAMASQGPNLGARDGEALHQPCR